MKEWPAYKTARDLASGKVFPVSEAVILQTARKHGMAERWAALSFSAPKIVKTFPLRGCPHADCRDDATVVSHQREGAVVSVRHRII